MSIASRALLTAVVAVLAYALPAQAGSRPLGTTVIASTSGSASTCHRPSFARPLLPFGDDRWYVAAPGGSFTAGTTDGWQLSAGARYVADAAGGGALALPPGSSAISPAMCVDLDYPHLRFAHRFTARDPSKGEIQVEVVYPHVRSPEWQEAKKFDGKQGDAAGTPGWRLSPDVDLKPDTGGKAWGARYVALRFTALPTRHAGEWLVDDVWIDPRMR